jgi:hypothetical protein
MLALKLCLDSFAMEGCLLRSGSVVLGMCDEVGAEA